MPSAEAASTVRGLEFRQKVKDVLDQILDLDPEDRTRYLNEICISDGAVRREVESLLAEHEAESPWHEGPIVFLRPQDNGGRPSPDASLEPGQRLGPYRIERLLGEGGMGSVVLAVREDDFAMRVALKVVRTDSGSEEIVHRFLEEREILARLQHPNIARIHDGGATDQGQPFFAMEYVEGRPIVEYCQQQNLSIRGRLELFLNVCSAVHFAHQNLVVHRDLKPDNILVTEDGTPKVLDFGIAKRLDGKRAQDSDGAPFSRLAGCPMTLRYASPEQIENKPITTAVDVYALGLLLYQMLTGLYPYSIQSGDSERRVMQAIVEEEPRPPSFVVEGVGGLRRTLAGDLDSIVLKAMRKEPELRYVSGEHLAEDIRRYLDSKTVTARRETWRYRTFKFVRRHKLPLVAATALVSLSLGFGVSATLLSRKAEQQRQRAVQEQERTAKAFGFMKDLFLDSGPDQAKGEDLTAVDLLRRGESRVRELEEPIIQAELLRTIGEVYYNLGLFGHARKAWDDAFLLMNEHHLPADPEVAIILNNRGSSLLSIGRYTEAEIFYRKALKMKQDLGGEEVDVAKSMSNIATALMKQGKYAEAEPLLRRALEIRRQRDGTVDRDVARSLRALGHFYFLQGDLKQAESLTRQAIDVYRAATDDLEEVRLASFQSALSRILHAQSRYVEAEELYRQVLRARQRRLPKGHTHIAISQADLARVLLDMEHLVQGREFLDQALMVLYRDPDEHREEIARAEAILGSYLTREGRYEEAEFRLVSSLQLLSAPLREPDIYVLDVRQRLRRLYLAWNRPENATSTMLSQNK